MAASATATAPGRVAGQGARRTQTGQDRRERARVDVLGRLLPGVVRGMVPERGKVPGRQTERVVMAPVQRAARAHVVGQRPEPDARAVELEGRPVVRSQRSVRLVAAMEVILGRRRLAAGHRGDRSLDAVRGGDHEPGHPVVEPGGDVRPAHEVHRLGDERPIPEPGVAVVREGRCSDERAARRLAIEDDLETARPQVDDRTAKRPQVSTVIPSWLPGTRR